MYFNLTPFIVSVSIPNITPETPKQSNSKGDKVMSKRMRNFIHKHASYSKCREVHPWVSVRIRECTGQRKPIIGHFHK